MESVASVLSSNTTSAVGGARTDKGKYRNIVRRHCVSVREDILSTIHHLVETEIISSLLPHFMEH